MNPLFDDIPVSIDVSVAEVLQGILEINGALTCTNDAILFTYRTKSLLGEGQDRYEVRIPFNEIREIRYKSNLFVSRILIQPRRLRTMESMPGESREEMKFKVKRKYHHLAKELVSHTKYRLFQEGVAPGSSIPFKLPNTAMGLTEHTGLMYLEDEFLVFEIQSGFSGSSKSDRRIIKIEPRALEAVRFEQGSVSDKVVIRPKKETLLDAMPGAFKEEIKLTVSKRHRDAVDMLIYQMREVQQ